MRQRFAMMWCDTCGRVTRGARPGMSYRHHLLLCVGTGGLWLLVWLVGAVRDRSQPYTCRYCGSSGCALDPPHREIVGVSLGLAAVLLLAVLALWLVRVHPDQHRHTSSYSRSATLDSRTSRAMGLAT